MNGVAHSSDLELVHVTKVTRALGLTSGWRASPEDSSILEHRPKSIESLEHNPKAPWELRVSLAAWTLRKDVMEVPS